MAARVARVGAGDYEQGGGGVAGDVVQRRYGGGARGAGRAQRVDAGDDEQGGAAQEVVGDPHTGVSAARDGVAEAGGEVGQQAAARLVVGDGPPQRAGPGAVGGAEPAAVPGSADRCGQQGVEGAVEVGVVQEQRRPTAVLGLGHRRGQLPHHRRVGPVRARRWGG
ncbi:hypothetical protein GCM10027168_63130 [Streptomyces capparidis]